MCTIGNPTTYKGNNLAWTHVRRLASYGANTFEYGADGIRTKKNGITYVLDGNKILRETDGASRNITYYYGTNGVVGFNYNGTDYYYRKNLQGDVIEIYTATGTLVAEYVYDAWGRVISVKDASGNVNTDASFIGNINPFRYRSYYYDTETGLYYLNSRYYDPETGRFINADDVQYLDPETLGGLSLYAYSLDNPVNMADPAGNAPKWWQWAFSGLSLAAGIACCFIPGAQALGVGLIVGGATSLTSNILSATGTDGRTASIITNVLSTVGGIALCLTPFAAIGASMIGSGVLGMAGGYISEALGGSFEVGSAIGNVVGGFLGGQLYKGLVNRGAIPFKTSVNRIVENPLDDINNPNIGPKQGLIVDKIHQIEQTGTYDILDVIKLPNGFYQVQDGHHNLRALLSLGYKYIWVQITK